MEKFNDNLSDIRRSLKTPETDEIRLRLSSLDNNDIDFNYLFSNINLIPNDTPPKRNYQQRLIHSAYSFFYEKVSTIDYENLRLIINKIFSGRIIFLEVGDSDDAYLLYETLNDRGEPLSPVDLIKSNLFSKILSQNPNREKEIVQKWKNMANTLESSLQTFFLHYYHVYVYVLGNESNSYSRANNTNLVKSYDKVIRVKADELFNDIIEKSKIYAEIIKPSSITIESRVDIDQEIIQLLMDLQHISAIPSHILLMYIFDKYPSIEIRKKWLINLSVFFVRRHLSDKPNTRELDSIFINIVEKIIKTQTQQIDWNDLINDELVEKSVNINQLKSILKGDIFNENEKISRYILCKIEEMNFTRENKKDLWEKVGKKVKWTIEHVLPQTDNVNDEWKMMFTQNNIENFDELHKKSVNKLGNLTLSVYNSNLSTLIFNQKKTKTDNNGQPIGYNNGLFLNNHIFEKEKWIPEYVEERTDFLIEEILKALKYPNDE
jgi:hypothetical protein